SEAADPAAALLLLPGECATVCLDLPGPAARPRNSIPDRARSIGEPVKAARGLAAGVLAPAIRVGYCIDSFDIGGTALNAIRTLRALDRSRFQVTVFHLHEPGALRARYEALGLQLLHLPVGPLYSPRTAAQGMRFLRLLLREAIEVVHTPDIYT